MRSISWIGTAARMALAAVLVYAGLVKMADLGEAGRAVSAYQIFSVDTSKLVGGVLPFVEVAVGLLLAIGLATRAAALITGVLLAAYLVAIASVWAKGLSIDCGCFGGGGALTSGAQRGYLLDIVRDVALLGAAVLLILNPRTRFALDRKVLDFEGV